MNILVVAANGRTGREVVKALLKTRHRVSVFIRDNEPEVEGINGDTFRGDATDFDAVSKAVKNQEVVISTIGHVKGSGTKDQTVAITNIAKAIENSNQTTKVVSLTGNGVRVTGDKVGIIDWFLNVSIKIIDPKRVADGIAHYHVLKKAEVNWVIVRVLKLSNAKPSIFSLTEHGPAKLLVSRQEVAKALVQVSETSRWDKKLPIVSR